MGNPAMIECPSCQHLVSASDTACPSCGSVLQNTKFGILGKTVVYAFWGFTISYTIVMVLWIWDFTQSADGAAIGIGIGVTLLIFLWLIGVFVIRLIGSIILDLTEFLTRPARGIPAQRSIIRARELLLLPPKLPTDQSSLLTGYLYVMYSPQLKGWCKIGKTGRNPEKRAAELSTGLPGRLEVYAECPTNDMHEAERQAHALLRKYRHSPRDEWFKIEAKEASRIIYREMSLDTMRIRKQKEFLNAFIGLAFIAVLALLIFA